MTPAQSAPTARLVPRVGFVMEQTLGHRTHAANIARFLEREHRLSAEWLPVPWEGIGPTRKLPGVRSNWTIRAGLAARRLVRSADRRTPLDALFVHTQVPAMLLGGRFLGGGLAGVPRVVSLDATPLQYDRLGEHYQHQPGPAIVERAKGWLHRRRFLDAEALVTWSEWARQSLIQEYGVAPARVSVISPGVHLGPWRHPGSRNRSPEDPVRILFVGGDLDRKGGTELLHAFRRLRDDSRRLGGPTPHLDLVTGSPVGPEPGITVHTGLTPNSQELIDLYHRADIFCLPTLGDCLPMVLSEAGAAGLPLVSTDVGAIHEVVRDGETGLLVPPGDASALYAALDRLVGDHDLRQRLGANAEKLVAEQHDAEANAARLVDLLLDVALLNAAERRSAAPATITVSGSIDPDLEGQVSAGLRPRADYTELARALGDAEILDRTAVRRELSLVGRTFERVLGPDITMAWACFRRRASRSLILTDGEQVGLPLALMSRVGGQRRAHHVMICHVMSPPEKAWPFRLLRLDRHIDRYLTYATSQTALLVEKLEVAREKVVQTSFMVDTEFFRPRRDPVDPPLICAVGLERRDYPTLFAAVRDLDVRVVVAAASPWSKQSAASSEVEVPANVEVCRLDPQALRHLYEQSRFLVMPLLPVDFQAGITAILEAMSMARPVVCSMTPGQNDTIVDGVTGVYVPHSDPQALRRAIEDLLADPARAEEMGRAARRHVVEHCDVRDYADRIAAAAWGRVIPDSSDGSPALAATFVLENHLGHGPFAINLRQALTGRHGLDAHWIEVGYSESSSRLGRTPGLPQPIAALLRARAEIRQGWPDHTDVMFFNTQVPAALNPWLTRRYPYVLSVDVTPIQYDRIAEDYQHTVDSSRLLRDVKHRRNRSLFHGAHAIVPWSTWARQSLIDDYGVDPRRIEVLPPGVDLDWWHPPADRPEQGEVQILFVGGDFHRKGGDVLLEAFRRLPPGRARLVLVTKTPVDAPPGVRVEAGLSPNSDALRRLYHQSDIFALPSRAEAFGLAAVEASAAGLPVVASDVGGLADIVIDGHTGLVTPAGDVDRLAEVLSRLIESPTLRHRLGAAARNRAVEHFDAVDYAERLLTILHRARDGQGAPLPDYGEPAPSPAAR